MKFVSRLLSRRMRHRTLPPFPRFNRSIVESLEPRRLMTVGIARIPNETLPQDSSPQTIDLTQSFSDNTTQQADLSFTTQSNNPTLIQPTVSGTNLILTLAPSLSGIADITISAKAPDGSQAAQIFRVAVPASSDRSLDVILGAGLKSFRYVEANDTYGTITLSGPGTADIHLGGDNLVQIGDHARGSNQEVESITLTGSTGATTLTDMGVTAKRNTLFPSVGDITTDGALGALNVHNTFVDGDVTVPGGVGYFAVDYAQDGTITLGQYPVPMRVKLKVFLSENLTTPSGISSINAVEWISTSSFPDSLSAAYINSVTSSSTFDAGLQLSSTGAGGKSLGNFVIGGYVGGTWNLAGPCGPLVIGASEEGWNATFTSLPYLNDRGFFGGSITAPAIGILHIRGEMYGALLHLTAANTTDLTSLTVLGQVVSSAIVSAGNLGPISAQTLQQSVIFAGIAPLQQNQVLPASTADLAETATIQSITLHPTAKLVGFLASDVAATTIGNLSFDTTKVDNSSVMFGVAASSIFHIFARDLSHNQLINLSNINDPVALANAIAASGLGLQDFTITVLQ